MREELFCYEISRSAFRYGNTFQCCPVSAKEIFPLYYDHFMQRSGVDKFAWVHAIRGYAIMLVVIVHSAQPIFGDGNAGILSSGDQGVQLFFIASAFTLFNSFARRQSIDGGQTKLFFFLRRFFRIAPLYWTGILAWLVYGYLTDSMWLPPKPFDPISVLVNAVFLNGIYPPAVNYIPPGSWSIGVEMLFYLTVPILFRYVTSWRAAVVFTMLAILCSVVVQLLAYIVITDYTDHIWTVHRDWVLYLWFPNQFPIFGFGMILYHVIRENALAVRPQRLLITSVAVFIALGTINFELHFPWFLIQREYLYAVVFIAFAWSLSKSNLKFLINPFVKLGEVSFSLYLIHPVIVELIYGALFPSPPVGFNGWISALFIAVATLAIGGFISTLTYRFIELPGIALGEQVIDRIRQRYQRVVPERRQNF